MRPSQGSRPRIFIGSSHEGRAIAECVQLGLDDISEATVWTQGVFDLSKGSLESLMHSARDYDFAVLVLTPDDVKRERGVERMAPRDNVIFELGLFMGALGRQRTFVVHPRDGTLELPTDLSGVTVATYGNRKDGNWEAAVGPACTKIKLGIRRCLEPQRSGPTDRTAAQRTTTAASRRRRRRSLGTARVTGPIKNHRVIDISVTGALLETDGELPIGQLLDLDLALDDQSRARVTAKVVRVQQPQWGRVGGVGVAFTRFERNAEKTIEQYVASEDEPLA